MTSNIIPFPRSKHTGSFSDDPLSTVRDDASAALCGIADAESAASVPLSPLVELVWDSHFFLNGLLFSVLEQLEILETAEWFRGRGGDLNRHRAANMDAASARRAPGITAAWLETKSGMEQLRAAILLYLRKSAGFETEKAKIEAWTADKPAGEFLKLCAHAQAAIEAEHGPQPVSSTVPAGERHDTAALRANPGRYGRDPKFLGMLRDICISAA